MNSIAVVFVVVFSVVSCVEHATDIQIDQVEVIEIPWQGDNSAQPQPAPPCPPDSYAPPPQEPNPVYGPPPNPVYGPPPKPVYGPPPEVTTTTELPTTTEGSTTTEVPTTTGAPGNESNIQSERLTADSSLSDQGVYYVYHPQGLLQRVAYSTNNDERNMEFSAKLKYQNVEPIKGPVYTYDPETFEFVRINK